MLCDNCCKREANVRYSENINGRRKDLNLCEECSKKLGITNMDFNMPIDFSSFFGEFMEDFAKPEFMPLLNEIKALKCDNCGFTFEDIRNTGKLGCGNCYSVFEERLDPIIRRIQGANKHIGRAGKIIDSKIEQKMKNVNNESDMNKPREEKAENNKLHELQKKLKQAIKEEKYEEAAKIRDEIKKEEN
ncbi:MAG: hypothetical protein HFJ36_03560 [Clostridia bacterium]|nr:hypothetical protein [Clostridia bacterium]